MADLINRLVLVWPANRLAGWLVNRGQTEVKVRFLADFLVSRLGLLSRVSCLVSSAVSSRSPLLLVTSDRSCQSHSGRSCHVCSRLVCCHVCLVCCHGGLVRVRSNPAVGLVVSVLLPWRSDLLASYAAMEKWNLGREAVCTRSTKSGQRAN